MPVLKVYRCEVGGADLETIDVLARSYADAEKEAQKASLGDEGPSLRKVASIALVSDCISNPDYGRVDLQRCKCGGSDCEYCKAFTLLSGNS
jgi:hypothetical protein